MIYQVCVHIAIVIIMSALIWTVYKENSSSQKGKHKLLFFHFGFWFVFFIMELRWIYVMPSQVDLMRSISVFDALLFLPGILLYAYVVNQLKALQFTIRYYHFLPLAIHVIIALCLLAIGKEYYVFIYDQRSLKWYYGLFEFSTLIFNGYFLIMTFRSIVKVKNEEIHAFSLVFQRYALVLLAVYLIAGAAWLVRTFTSQEFVWIYEFSRSVLMVGLGYLGYYLVFRRNILDFSLPESLPRVYQRLDDSSISVLKEKVTTLVEEEQIFLKDQLTLSEFSKSIDTSPNDLSWLLNNAYGKNFYEFLNQYRVQFFLERVRENAHKDQTILSLALESGFRSNATFYKAFKAETGQTPNQYIRGLQEVEA